MPARRAPLLVLLAATVLATGCSDDPPAPLDEPQDTPGQGGTGGVGGGGGGPGGAGGGPDCPHGILPDGKRCAPTPPAGVTLASCAGGGLEEPAFAGGAICLPEAPRKSSPGCPGASFTHPATGDGFAICLPEQPHLESWSCRNGWIASPAFAGPLPAGATAHEVCEAPPLPLCGAGQLAVPGEADCLLQGAPCGAAPWPDEVALRARAPAHPGAVLHVDPAAAPGGDGSRAAPFAAATEALAAATDGDLIALSAGPHQGPLLLDKAVALLGSCTTGTRLAAAAGSAAVTISGAGEVVLADLTVLGPAAGVELTARSGTTRLVGITVSGATGAGVRATGGPGLLQLTDVVVEGTQEGADPAGGFGLILSGGATAELTRVAFEGNSGTALSVGDAGSSLVAEEVAIRGGTGRALDGDGRGLRVRDGATAEVRGLVISGGVGIGVVAGEASTLLLEDAQVSGIASRTDGNLGRGATIQSAASATLHRVRLVDDLEYGLVITDPGTTLAADRLLIERIEWSANGTTGRGLQAVGGAVVTLQRAIVRRCREVGIALFDSGTTLEAHDLVVHDLLPDSEGYLGRGFAVLDGAALTGARLAVTATAETGIFARGAGTTVTLSDTSVTGTGAEEATGLWGYGLSADDAAVIELQRALLEGNSGCGACSRDGGLIRLHDSLIRGTRPLPAGTFGRGGGADRGASFQLFESAVVENHEASLFAADFGSSLVAQDVLVTASLPEESSGLYGGGVVLLLGATGSVIRGVISESAQVGVSADNPGTSLGLSHVDIRDVSGLGAEGEKGRGIEVKGGARLEGDVVQLRAVSEAALAVVDPGTEVVLRGLVVRGGSNPAIPLGRAMNVQEGAHVELGPALLVGATDLAVVASHEGTVTELNDLVIRSTESTLDGWSGTGLVAQLGAQVTLRRAVLVENRDVGLIAVSPGTVLDAADLVIASTRNGACHELTCYAGGTGAGTYDGALLRLTDFWIDGNPLVGLQVAERGEIEARRGLVSRNVIGVNLEVEELDLDTAFVEVFTFENGRDLDALELPLPHLVQQP